VKETVVVKEGDVPVTPPSKYQIARSRTGYGLGMAPGEVEEFRELIAGAVTSYDVVERLYQASRARLPVRRCGVRRPSAPRVGQRTGAWYAHDRHQGNGDGPLGAPRRGQATTSRSPGCR